MKSTLIGGVIASAITLAMSVSAANATVIDFIDYIDNINGEEGVADGTTRVINGVAVTFSAYNLAISFDSGTAIGDIDASNSNPFAYFDKGNAGVGVCQVLDSDDQCNPSNDDNVTAFKDGDDFFDEVLGISFATDMIINSLSFRDSGHKLGFDRISGSSTAEIAIGASDPGANNIVAGLFDLEGAGNPGGVDGTILGTTLSGGPGGYVLEKGDVMLFTYVNEQFYLSAMDVQPVPVPAAGGLLLGAIGGLSIAARRRRRKS